MKKNIKVAQEFYETYERLKYHDDFVKFKENIVFPRIDLLADEILNHPVATEADRICLVTDVLLYKKLEALFITFFTTAEDQSVLLRKTQNKREKARKELLA